MGKDGFNKFIYGIEPFYLFLPHILSRRNKITERLFEIDKAGKVIISFLGFIIARALFQNDNAGIYIGILKPALNLRFNDGSNLVVL